jgi:hypothetical protein
MISLFIGPLDLVRLFPIHMDCMGLEKFLKKFDLFGIQTHPIPLNPHGLRANRTSPQWARISTDWIDGYAYRWILCVTVGKCTRITTLTI